MSRSAMTKTLLLAMAAALLAPAAAAASAPTPTEILAAAPAEDWARIDPADLLVIDLTKGGRVVIALADAFAPVHLANIRLLARSGWFDGVSVVRVQDNYVVQWGVPNEAPKPLPPGIVKPAPAEYERPARGLAFTSLAYSDSFAPIVGYSGGFPVAQRGGQAWLAHCYGMVGVARDIAPDTGTGQELYTVIGQAPRALDRNIAVVGRIVAGMELLTALPRGTADLGFYAQPVQRTGIAHIRLASDLPIEQRPAIEWLRPESGGFKAWVHARANRQDAFYGRPAGAIDLCNALPPVRSIP